MGRKFGYVLGTVMVLMALLVILDSSRQTAQMKALNDVLAEDTKSRQALQGEIKALAKASEKLAEGDVARTATATELAAQLETCREALATNAAGSAALAAEVAALRQRIEAGVAISTDSGAKPPPENGGVRPPPESGGTKPPPEEGGVTSPPEVPPGTYGDGIPILGKNFLMPAEDRFDPRRLRGTRRAYKETPKGLNSLKENAATNSDIDELVNDTLCGRDAKEPMRWRSRLATSCVISDDYRVFTFTLRQGVFWQIPTMADDPRYAFLRQKVELTADDFAFYVQMLKDPAVECPHQKVYFEQLASAEALDRYTLRVVWSEKLYTNISASLALEPLPRHIYGVNADGTPYAAEVLGQRFNQNHWFDAADQHVGVGPYRLFSYQPDEEMVFARNPDYWGATQHFEKIAFNLRVKEAGAQLTGFKNGDVHTFGLQPQFYRTEILDGSEPRFAPYVEGDPRCGRQGELGWERVKVLAYSYIGWNMKRPLFADARVRRAMSHAFPRERIIKEVYMGLGEPIDTNVHPDSPYANKDLPAYAFSLAKAARLLAAAGWGDADEDGWLDKDIKGVRTPLRFEVKIYADSNEWDRTMAIYAEELKKIGVEMSVKRLEWKDLLKVYEDKDFDAISGGWRMGYEVDFKQLWSSEEAEKPGSSNHCGFADPRADALIEQMRSTFDFAERVKIAKEFQEVIHELQPYTFFRSSEGIFVWQNRKAPGREALGGVTEALDALHPFYNRDPKWWYFVE